MKKKNEGKVIQLKPVPEEKALTAAMKERVEEIDQILAQNKAVVDAFVNDPIKRSGAVELAYQIQRDFPEWFTVTSTLLFYKTSQAEMAAKIELLMLFNLCTGKVEDNVPYFHIDIDHKIMRQLIKDEIAVKEGEVLFLKEKLSKLK